MQKLIYTNENKETIEFDNKPPIILEHLELGEVLVEKLSGKGIGQDGVSILGKTLGSRIISISCCIIANTEKERFEIRRKIGSVLNPYLEGFLLYHNGFKSYKINTGVNISIDFGEVFENRRMQRFDVDLFCKDPYFLEEKDIIKNFLEVTPRLTFPLKIRKKGYIFSSLAGGQLEVFNRGDAPAPIKIIIEGPAFNPSIKNLTTKELLKINYRLKDGEKAIITTDFGNKTVSIVNDNNEEKNGFHYLDTQANICFFSLKPGKNILKFSADVGADTGKMKVIFNPKYLML